MHVYAYVIGTMHSGSIITYVPGRSIEACIYKERHHVGYNIEI